MEKQAEAEQRIEKALQEGRWGLLERLPAERRLADELGVSRGTLRAVLHSLAGRGIVETLRGSGTIVRAIPHENRRQASSTMRQAIEAFRLLMPPIVSDSVGLATQTSLLEMERILPSAGLALRNGDMPGFVKAQLRFFTGIIRMQGNPVVAAVAAQILPDHRPFIRLLQKCDLQENEALFAVLAKLLGALRHADAEGAVNATKECASLVLAFLERHL
ncbi:MAG: FadR family transcriptional regulator [Desulfovibrionaceae bacterium]|nr:FadR family transcriptional regulator [Desulfovibrionaceae bacterium]